MSNEDFFVTPEKEKNAILLIDASGSVLQQYPEPNFNGQKTVFEKMQEICSKLPHENFRCVFWNSDNAKQRQYNMFQQQQQQDEKPLFETGVFKVPFAVPQNSLALQFKIARKEIDQFCLTMPHLGFASVSEWLQSGFSRTVYFVTDGLIAWDSASDEEKRSLGTKLAREIKALVEKFRDLQLHILAVERNSAVNYNTIESMDRVVGNDIFKIISDNRLTGMVATFISHTPRHAAGYSHIDRGVQTPKGFVPYEKRYFSPLSTPQFLKYIANQITAKQSDEDALLKIVQNLSPTLNVLTADKPQIVKSKTLELFCKMFERTVLDASAVQFLLSRAVTAEASGSAQLYSEYRANLKNRFKDAGRLLSSNAAQAMMMENRCLTLPLPMSNGKLAILVANSCMLDQTILGYANGGYLYNGKLIPAIPFVSTYAGSMIKQCTRQWLRALLSVQYHVNLTSDEIIVIMMTINLQVQLALLNNVSETAKTVCVAYQTLVTVMLEKMRLNSQTTEIDQLYAGNLFVPNDGNVASFTRFMQNAAARIGAPAMEPLHVWYYLCLAHSQKLANSQFAHCQQFVKIDSALVDIASLTPPSSIILHQLAEKFDYTCLITMESTAETGGFRLLPHKDALGHDCSPVQVLSESGMKQLLAHSQTSMCPICYSPVTQESFAAVAKCSNDNSDDFDVSLLDTEKYRGAKSAPTSNLSNSSSSATSTSSSGSSAASMSSSSSANFVPPAPTGAPSSRPGTLVLLCGTVGCGKSTYAAELQRLEEEKGKYCLVTGSDKFVQQGVARGADAAQRVKQELQAAQQNAATEKIVILDTCGENFNSRNVFGVDLSNWKIERVWVNLDRKQLQNYSAWSLYNVINRSPGEAVLNPHSAGLSVCVDVHLRKIRAHFGKKTPEIVSKYATKEEILTVVQPGANAYLAYLTENKEKFAPKAL